MSEKYTQIKNYIQSLNEHYKTEKATEHSYRIPLENFIAALFPKLQVINEPSKTDCGNPDFLISNEGIPIGYIEAKDVDKNLENKEFKEQFERYKKGLDNLIITNYLEFQFFSHSEFLIKITIASIENGKIIAHSENFSALSGALTRFCDALPTAITKPKMLAEKMAARAKFLQDIFFKALSEDEENKKNTELKRLFNIFKKYILPDIDVKTFSDTYAQTIAYGMFLARLRDKTLENFDRKEAVELLPKNNPFLRKFFKSIADDIDERIKWGVDNLAELFRYTDLGKTLEKFDDADIHFYETFLTAYNPDLRKSRGAYYTPKEVVNYIVEGIDFLLKKEFSILDGLANTEKFSYSSKNSKAEKKDFHRIQILDPATGTGTFLVETINYIYKNKFKGNEGAWSSYVKNHLIPRLNGFEILIAPYTITHLNLTLSLQKTNTQEIEERFKIYLTDALTNTTFQQSELESYLTDEIEEANKIKQNTPLMVVLGNPPYNAKSTNKGKEIMQLIEDYKYIGEEHFKEKKHWLGDDYVKFIRYGQHFIEKKGQGILAFITNHSFLDNPTFRGMRWNLLKNL